MKGLNKGERVILNAQESCDGDGFASFYIKSVFWSRFVYVFSIRI